jgi:hypothetical protein
MKIFERRMRVSWPNFLFGTVFAGLALLSFISDDAAILRGHFGSTRHFLKEQAPTAFFCIVSAYAVFALGGYFFALFTFRRGSWMNPR